LLKDNTILKLKEAIQCQVQYVSVGFHRCNNQGHGTKVNIARYCYLIFAGVMIWKRGLIVNCTNCNV